MSHLSHNVFYVAYIKATFAREMHCVCLGCKGEVNLCYLSSVLISVHARAGAFRKDSDAPLFPRWQFSSQIDNGKHSAAKNLVAKSFLGV